MKKFISMAGFRREHLPRKLGSLTPTTAPTPRSRGSTSLDHGSADGSSPEEESAESGGGPYEQASEQASERCSFGRASATEQHARAAVTLQRFCRGVSARKQCSALAQLTAQSTVVQRRWRRQKKEMAVLQMQFAARTMLEQRRREVEAGVGESVGVGARWRHDRSMEALRGTLQAMQGQSDVLSTTTCKGATNQNPLQVVAQAFSGIVERSTSKSAYPEVDSIVEALVEHCGWLLKLGRAVHSWKIRWVMLQAGYLWYFRDPSRKEPLGRMSLYGCTVAAEGSSRRHLVLTSSLRTLHLVAGNGHITAL